MARVSELSGGLQGAVAAPGALCPVSLCSWPWAGGVTAVGFTAQRGRREWELEAEVAWVLFAGAMVPCWYLSCNCCFFSGHRDWDDPGGADF